MSRKPKGVTQKPRNAAISIRARGSGIDSYNPFDDANISDKSTSNLNPYEDDEDTNVAENNPEAYSHISSHPSAASLIESVNDSSNTQYLSTNSNAIDTSSNQPSQNPNEGDTDDLQKNIADEEDPFAFTPSNARETQLTTTANAGSSVSTSARFSAQKNISTTALATTNVTPLPRATPLTDPTSSLSNALVATTVPTTNTHSAALPPLSQPLSHSNVPIVPFAKHSNSKGNTSSSGSRQTDKTMKIGSNTMNSPFVVATPTDNNTSMARQISRNSSNYRQHSLAASDTPIDTHSTLLPPNTSSDVTTLLSSEDPTLIYHRNSLSTLWLSIAAFIHIVQWSLLLSVGSGILTSGAIAILAIIVITVFALLIVARCLVRKSSAHERITHTGDGRVRYELHPEDETDNVPTSAIVILMTATALEGLLFAVFSSVAAGKTSNDYSEEGYKSQSGLTEILRFASITLLAFHRTIRPANRIDPMRTILELEVVNVCWDALDGSTLYQLLNTLDLSSSLATAIRALMAFWYLSVGARIAIMFSTHLKPESPLYKLVLDPPHAFSNNPIVDRSLSALRLRCTITMAMAFSEFYALAVRGYLWSHGMLDALQQEMFLKNLLFLSTIVTTYTVWRSTITRRWNQRDLILGLKIPKRLTQMRILRWSFAAVYMVQGGLMTSILAETAPGGGSWSVCTLFDAAFVIHFLLYCKNVHLKNSSRLRRMAILPQPSFVLFPARLALSTSALLALNLFVVRVPAIYMNAGRMVDDTSGQLATFNNAMLVVTFSAVSMCLCAQFWSNAYLLFQKEFTACLDGYHAIHDPVTCTVSTATMAEGVLDVLSAASLMTLATLGLSDDLNNAIVLFVVLELLNACQCFGLQALLSGGHNDSPMDLVRWKAILRVARAFIDTGVIILRVTLWARYGVINSVFLIKNLYNLLHTAALVERYFGGRHYPVGTLFASEVRPAEWYDLTEEQWRSGLAGDPVPDPITREARIARNAGLTTTSP